MRSALRVVALTIFGAVLSSAAPVFFEAGLTTDQEIPPPTVTDGSNPNGFASAAFDADTMQLAAGLAWAGMTTPVVAAHIHRIDPAAAVPGTGPVVVGFFMGESFPTEGDFVSDIINLTEDQTAAIAAGLLDGTLYFNVHTDLNPAGEIRGNIPAAVPEPSSVALVLGGALAVLLRRRLLG